MIKRVKTKRAYKEINEGASEWLTEWVSERVSSDGRKTSTVLTGDVESKSS